MSYAIFPDLEGRRCIVSGASNGLGAAVALALGAQHAHVLVHYHRDRSGAEAVAERIRGSGGQATAYGCDLAGRGAGAVGLVDAAVRAFGGLDIVVNVAGGFERRASLAETDESAFDGLIDLNFRSTVSVCRAALPLLVRTGKGAIINTTSVGARTGGATGAVLYNAAKGAVSTFTRGLAREAALLSVRVNAVAPGVIATRLQSRTTSKKMLADAVAAIPLRRPGVPDDCVHAYLFLASSLASAYITGQVIEVNGGQLMP